jgi:transposase-like protein
MAIKKDVLDELLAGADGKGVFGKNGLFDELKKALAEGMLNAEMDHHLTQEQLNWPQLRQSSQWLFEKDGSDGRRKDRDRGPAGSGGNF